MTPITKSDLLELLRTSETPVTVSFTKRDGSGRVMQATLHPEHIPEVHGYSTKPSPEHLLTVFDVEKNSWRVINFSDQVYVITE